MYEDMLNEKEAIALVKQDEKSNIILVPELEIPDVIQLGKPVLLLTESGRIIRTSKVIEWRLYGGFHITTTRSHYCIRRDYNGYKN